MLFGKCRSVYNGAGLVKMVQVCGKEEYTFYTSASRYFTIMRSRTSRDRSISSQDPLFDEFNDEGVPDPNYSLLPGTATTVLGPTTGSGLNDVSAHLPSTILGPQVQAATEPTEYHRYAGEPMANYLGIFPDHRQFEIVLSGAQTSSSTQSAAGRTLSTASPAINPCLAYRSHPIRFGLLDERTTTDYSTYQSMGEIDQQTQQGLECAPPTPQSTSYPDGSSSSATNSSVFLTQGPPNVGTNGFTSTTGSNAESTVSSGPTLEEYSLHHILGGSLRDVISAYSNTVEHAATGTSSNDVRGGGESGSVGGTASGSHAIGSGAMHMVSFLILHRVCFV